MDAVAGALRGRGFGLVDVALAVALVGGYVFGDLYLALGVSVIVMMIFAMSLDLAQGYAGIETLGHAAFFGSGAYAAGLYAMHGSSEPLSGLAVGAASAAVVGLVTGIAVLRTKGLTQLMLTLTSATLLFELANAAKVVTMGDDGLSGYSISPILGMFAFDIEGRVAYVYASVVLVVLYLLAKYLVSAPLGLTIQGIRDNPLRMRLLGVHVQARLLCAYAISAAFAGVAGALSAQINGIVGLDALGFTLSANVLVMLALGGTGRLYGAFIGAIVFVLLSDRAAAVDPTNWLAALGVLLILVVRFAPTGLMGGLDRALARLKRGSRGESLARRITP